MAANNENKTLQQLIKKFSEVSSQTKDLDEVIANFSTVIEDFHITMLDVDKKINASEMASLSKEAIKRLNEIRAFNQMMMIETLESIVKSQTEKQTERLNKLVNDHAKKSVAKIEQQLAQLTATLSSSLEDNKRLEENDKRQEELLSYMKRIEMQTKSSGAQQWVLPPQNNEEIVHLRRLISNLNGKLKRLEKDYEDRITQLENELELLKANQRKPQQEDPYANIAWDDIDDDDLPI